MNADAIANALACARRAPNLDEPGDVDGEVAIDRNAIHKILGEPVPNNGEEGSSSQSDLHVDLVLVPDLSGCLEKSSQAG